MDISIEILSERFKLLGDKTRLSILALLRERDMCVCEFVEVLHCSQPGVSQHLKKLKQANLVREYRKGHWIYYQLNKEEIPELTIYMVDIPNLKKYIDQEQVECEA
ncbi:MAG: hypothetical protein RLZZ267_1362 [Bacillota bacterium]